MAYKERASSAEYLRITSPFSSWYSRSEIKMMSPWLIQIFFRSLPRIRPRRLTPSKHYTILSAHCFLSLFRVLWPGSAYHGIESAVAQHLEDLGVLLAFLLEGELALLIAVNPSVSDCETVEGEDRGSATHSFSFFPLRRFLPPFPLFLGILTERAPGGVPGVKSGVGKSRRWGRAARFLRSVSWPSDADGR